MFWLRLPTDAISSADPTSTTFSARLKKKKKKIERIISKESTQGIVNKIKRIVNSTLKWKNPTTNPILGADVIVT